MDHASRTQATDGEATRHDQRERQSLLRDLLQSGKQQERELETARRPFLARETLWRAAVACWEKFRLLRDDRREESEIDSAQYLAPRICAFGAYLVQLDLIDRLDAVIADPHSGGDRKIAALTLRAAGDNDAEQVAEALRDMAATLWSTGLDARHQMCEVLPRELLGIEPDPEPPPGWEGSLLPFEVKTPEDLISWLDQTEMIELATYPSERRSEPADMRLVRDAYRLAESVGLSRLPPIPLHHLNVGQQLAALANLRLAVKDAQKITGQPTDEGSSQELVERPEEATNQGGAMDYERLAIWLRELLAIHAEHCPGEVSGDRFERFRYLAINSAELLVQTGLPLPGRFPPDTSDCPGVAYFSNLNVPSAQPNEAPASPAEAVHLLPCCLWLATVKELADRAETRHRNHHYEPNEPAPGHPLVLERLRRAAAPAGLNLEATRKVAAGFTADWFLPADLAERWQSWTFPAESTRESVTQWQQLEEESATLSYRQGQESGQRHLAMIQNDLALLVSAQLPVEKAETGSPETGLLTPPDEELEESWMPTGRAAEILKVMLDAGLVDEEHSQSMSKITKRVDPDLSGKALTKPFRTLREHGLIVTPESGCMSGTYLTPAGKEMAQRLKFNTQ